ncbi:MAG: nucleotide exchange factor GrpE [Deltaproteobacteria bacterium GWB2_65_81]|nr:MAG: nucleotide exchange factor GrpE [Deltaproteobacteria bacterium GWA2_65_63]OGP26153.1 MAG: nucleotide exchange factor GrpE [Deltaproteobacteria bacterium GWB2_65_81]OGP38595.1 MAG: nucleotide exchange factor GrpE [Deltaproteobacteria bacterium GWC2_66_88]HAM32537.1 nucleotide exchange factor GrpE [Deltaproteobacteria bacterium]
MNEREKESPPVEAVEEVAPAEDRAGEPAGPGEAGWTDDAAQLKNQLAYLAAEFDNYRKRVARDREAQAAFGNEQLLRAILPFLDNLERAMSQAESSAEALLSGVRMTYDQFLAELRKFGLEQFSGEGGSFDPSLHEAIASVPWGGKPEGTVLSEARKGYLLHGRLLRPAQVTVAAAPPGDGTGDASDGSAK